MGNLPRLAALWITAAFATLFFHHTACARTPRPAAIIITPKRDAPVCSETVLFGKLLLPGRPVVLVREDRPASPWHVQAAGHPTDGKTFRSRVTFGSDGTPQGQRFFVMVVLMRNTKHLEIFRPGTAIEHIPWDVPRSAAIPVVLDRREEPPPKPVSSVVRSTPGSTASHTVNPVAHVESTPRDVPRSAATPVALGERDEPPLRQIKLVVRPTPGSEISHSENPVAHVDSIPRDEPPSATIPAVLNERKELRPQQTNEIISPTPGSKVSNMEDLVAHVEDDASVIAMVRSNESASYWWVQDIVEKTHEGKITATVRFGNQSTKSGTRFSIVLLLPTSAKDLDQFQVGDYMRHLPENIRKSKEVNVILQ